LERHKRGRDVATRLVDERLHDQDFDLILFDWLK
jgi:hypothetical protein